MGLVHAVVLVGLASWYGPEFQGHETASGETYNQEELTAASKTIPLGTWVTVTNTQNHRHVRLRINDRGPFVADRILDVSWKAAYTLGMLQTGLAKVTIKEDKQSVD